MIYFVQDSETGRIKIGFAANPWRRLNKIQSDTPGVLTLLAAIEGTVAEEAALHVRFGHLRVRGEWFCPGADIREFLATLPAAEKPLTHMRSRAFWNGKTGAQVAREIGVPKSTISNIQNGLKRPSPDMAIRIQRATGVSAIKLVFGELAEEAL